MVSFQEQSSHETIILTLQLFSWNFQSNFQSKSENPFYNAGIMEERANSPQLLKDKLPFYSANLIFLTCFNNRNKNNL